MPSGSKAELLKAARATQAKQGETDEYGTRYIIHFECARGEKTAMIRSAWMIRTDESFPRLLTCYDYRSEHNMEELELLSVVALSDEVPEKGLGRGQVGTIVEALAAGVYEVEFSDDDGRTYAFASFPECQLIRLYHQPKDDAA